MQPRQHPELPRRPGQQIQFPEPPRTPLPPFVLPIAGVLCAIVAIALFYNFALQKRVRLSGATTVIPNGGGLYLRGRSGGATVTVDVSGIAGRINFRLGSDVTCVGRKVLQTSSDRHSPVMQCEEVICNNCPTPTPTPPPPTPRKITHLPTYARSG